MRTTLLCCRLTVAFSLLAWAQAFTPSTTSRTFQSAWRPLFAEPEVSRPTELPDSLEDAAVRAAEASAAFVEASGPLSRCRVDFDPSVGDETFSMMKISTEFMQNHVTALCYAMIPGLQEARMEQMKAVATAKADLKELEAMDDEERNQEREDALVQLIARDGRPTEKYEGPVARIYFPDEGSAALARRDWTTKVPACVQFSSCGGVQVQDISQDVLVFFFCPKASEAEYVEELLAKSEATAANLKLTTFVNPVLVDMGVTGFGMAGRRLRERLIDGLQPTYYLRTLAWGALTRQWPLAYSVWQEDADAAEGYRLIKMMDRLPSNPEVEDIYDIENGLQDERQSGGVLDQFGDFVNGMMRL